jgi:hypothetical protein
MIRSRVEMVNELCKCVREPAEDSMVRNAWESRTCSWGAAGFAKRCGLTYLEMAVNVNWSAYFANAEHCFTHQAMVNAKKLCVRMSNERT